MSGNHNQSLDRALGATVIQKHFTLRRADGGIDSAFFLEQEEVAALVTEAARAWQAMGRLSYVLLEKERAQSSKASR